MDLRLHWTAGLLTACILAAPAASQTTPAYEQEKALTLELELGYVHDDNVRLGSGVGDLPSEEIQKDEVVRIQPKITVDKTFGEHSFRLNGLGVFREGTDTDLSEETLIGNAELGLVFDGGLTARIYDRYFESEFDEALFLDLESPTVLEPGVTSNTINRLGAQVAYTPLNRLSFEAYAEDKQESFEFARQADLSDDRDGLKLGGRITVPIAEEFVAYVRGEDQEEESGRFLERNFERQRLAAGVRWEGKNRFRVWAEAGQGEVDYADSPTVEFEADVWQLGTEILIDDISSFRAFVGENAWGEPEATVLYQRLEEDLDELRVRFQMTTGNAFAVETLGRIYDLQVFSLRWRKHFAERFRFTFDGSYFELDAKEGVEELLDETTSARLRLSYLLMGQWLRVGVLGQYSERASTRDTNEYEDTRVGAYLTLRY